MFIVISQLRHLLNVAGKILTRFALLTASGCNVPNHLECLAGIAFDPTKLNHRDTGIVEIAGRSNRRCRHGIPHAVDILADPLYALTNVARGIARSFSQFAYFIGNNSEAPALFTRTRRLNGGVEGKQIGLGGNLGNQIDNDVYFK